MNQNSPLLSSQEFLSVVRHAPLVAIDLVVRDSRGRTLVGMRNNPPAQGFWFAPGGRIRKNEALDVAFGRITAAELGVPLQRSHANLLGLYDHFYDEDFSGGLAGTHYVVLAHELRLDPDSLVLPEEQHSAYRWVTATEALADTRIHPNTQAYFV